MIGDNIKYHPEYKTVTTSVIEKLKKRLLPNSKLCISVGGESGCGKSSLANVLLTDIQSRTKLKGFVFHADDYFYLPPRDNHNARLSDINLVGIEEVNLGLMNAHIKAFKNNEKGITKPLVNYQKNNINTENVNVAEIDFCIVEGAYVSLLPLPDFKIFIEATYKDTKHLREKRGRDTMSFFNEQVLEIEHQIIKGHHKFAHAIINENLNIKYTEHDE